MAADATYPVETIAELLDLTQRRVYQLTNEGIGEICRHCSPSRVNNMSGNCDGGVGKTAPGNSTDSGRGCTLKPTTRT